MDSSKEARRDPEPLLPIGELPHTIEAWLMDHASSYGLTFISLAGGSGSGKTYATKMISQIPYHVVHYSMDNYMKGKQFVATLLATSPDTYGWDDPLNFDLESFTADLLKLKRSGSTSTPIFDRASSERAQERKTIVASKGSVVVVEGLHALSLHGDIDTDLRIYIHASLHDRLWRRAVRNTLSTERNGSNLSNLIQNYLLRVEPSFRLHIQPYASRADITVANPAIPEQDYAYALNGMPVFDGESLRTLKLIPRAETGVLKAGEHLYLTEQTQELIYVIGDKELLRYPLSDDAVQLLASHYEVQ